MIPHDYEDWIPVDWGAGTLISKLGLSVGAAESTLRRLCAEGIVRSGRTRYEDDDRTVIDEPPEIIRPNEWGSDQLDLTIDEDTANEVILISEDDLDHWLAGQVTTGQGEASSPRDTAIIKRLPRTASWKEFCDHVRDDADGWITVNKQRVPARGFSDKQIQRAVERLGK
jgi:hypothetical protein